MSYSCYYYAEITVVWGTTGVFVYEVSIPRQLVAGVKLLVSLRSVKLLHFAMRIDVFIEANFEFRFVMFL